MADKAEKRNSQCKNQAESRFVPGKSPERLSPYYRLSCDAGTSLINTWGIDESTEPLYFCEAHANEFKSSTAFRRGAESVARRKQPIERGEQKEQQARHEPQVSPTPVAVIPARAPSAPIALHVASSPQPAHNAPVPSAKERCEAIDRQIRELVFQMENILSESEAAIDVAAAVDVPIEQTILEIIGDAAMSDTQKDTAMARLGDLQKVVKLDTGERMYLPEAYRLKRGLEACLSAELAIPHELMLAYRALHGSLEKAIRSALLEKAGDLVGTS